MSHNTYKIGTSEPDREGDIAVNTTSLSDITETSPSSGQVLKWSGSAWTNSSATYAQEFMLIGQGETNAYSNSTTATTIADGDTLNLYDTSPINRITGSTITKYLTTDWVTSVTLPAGNYIIMASYEVEFSASGYMSFQFKDSSNNVVSGRGAIGANLPENASGYLQSYREFTSSTTIRLTITNISNVATVANQGNTPAQRSSIMFWKV